MARVFFAGYDVAGKLALWVTHGTAASTHEINSTGVRPAFLTAFGHHEILFNGLEGLWVSNGTAAGTHQIAVNGTPPRGGNPSFITALNQHEALFEGLNANNIGGLWVTDGTTAGTHEIAVNQVFFPRDFTIVSGEAFFVGDSPTGVGLWMTDGTTAGTHEVVINGGTRTDGVEAQNLVAFNNEVLFSGANANNVVSLWVSDGTTPGTHEVPVSGAYVTGVHPTELTVFNNEVLFDGIDAAGIYGLWVYNGQSASEITGIKGAADEEGLPGGGLRPLDMTVFNHEVLFGGRDSDGFEGLWVTDGTAAGTHEIAVNGAGLNGVGPANLTVLNQHEVLFNGLDAAGIQGLWVTDGTTAGTHEMTDISGASPNGLVPTDLTLLPSGVQKSEPLRDSPNLALLGQYMASTFAMPSDGHGEKVIADPALSQQLSLVPPHA
jgi:ELWxxDGT repeat protein